MTSCEGGITLISTNAVNQKINSAMALRVTRLAQNGAAKQKSTS
jgi:hypothetical protein